MNENLLTILADFINRKLEIADRKNVHPAAIKTVLELLAEGSVPIKRGSIESIMSNITGFDSLEELIEDCAETMDSFAKVREHLYAKYGDEPTMDGMLNAIERYASKDCIVLYVEDDTMTRRRSHYPVAILWLD